jgi:hypothetical protein
MWWLFLAFNALMAFWVFSAIRMASDQYSSSTDAAHQAGTAIGGTMATGAIFVMWLIGSAILGLIVALTRGKEVTTEKIVN